jgi:RND superfamily putative drug exporter
VPPARWTAHDGGEEEQVFARLGRFCFVHRRLVVLVWLVVLVLGGVIGGQVFGRLTPSNGSAGAESVQGLARLDATDRFGGQVLAVVDHVNARDPSVRAAVLAAAADVRRIGGVGRVLDPYEPAGQSLVARDQRAVLLQVDLTKDDSRDDQAVAAATARLRQLADTSPGARVLIGGDRVVTDEINAQVEKDTKFGETVALPVTLLVMVFIFGGLVAAGIPFLGALFSIAGGLLALLLFSHVMDLDPSVVSVTTVMALGLSIDYSLLMVSRYREERGLGLSTSDAVERTLATAGRTVTFSALTVATSLSGLFVFQTPIYRAIGAAGVSVVVVALLGSLTLVPALLGFFGRRVRAPSRPVPDEGFFSRLARATQRRAVVVTVGCGVLLLTAGIPFLHANFQNTGADLLPKSFESRQQADLLAARFPGGDQEPLLVVARTDTRSLDAWARALKGQPDVAGVAPAERRSANLSVVEVTPTGDGQSAAAQRLVHRLRAERPPAQSWVTGQAAFLVDFKHEVATHFPWALGLIVLATTVLLFLLTGSLLVPLKALVMNVLSMGASFGALVLIFQDGHLSSLLGFTSTGGMETWVPVIVFAFAFGLSMDYEVFLISRIKELYDAGLPNDRAVVLGLQRSGRIITSAALLVVIVFAGFAAGKMLGIKELGVALTIALAVDATVVRCLLVPATMSLLGDLNWWAPAPLRRLHRRLGLREAPAAASGVPTPRDAPQAPVAEPS